MCVALVLISVASNQHTRCYHPSDPQQGLQEGGILLWVVHLASQGGTTGNMHGHYFLTSQVHSSASLTFHYYAHGEQPVKKNKIYTPSDGYQSSFN